MSSRRIDTLTTERDKQAAALERARAELAELQARPVEITATSVPDEAALEEARRAGAEEAAKAAKKEAEEKLKAKLDKSQQAKADAEAALAAARESLEAVQRRAETLERQVKVSGTRELATMSVCFESAQETFNKMLGCLQKLALAGNHAEHDKLVDALRTLLTALSERVPQKLEVSGDD